MPTLTDADFFTASLDASHEATLRAAWELTAPTLADLPAPGSLPPTEPVRTANNILTEWPKLRAEEAAVLAWFADAHQAELQRAIHSIPRLCFATRFAHLQLDLHDNLRAVGQLLPTASELRRVGLHWADIAVSLNLTTAEQVARIRAGRGHDDTATDLQALADLLTPLLPTLLPLQVTAAPTDHLDAETLQSMAKTGHQLLAALRAAPQTQTWLQDLRRVVAALQAAWTDATHAQAYHRQRVGGAAPLTFFQVARRA